MTGAKRREKIISKIKSGKTPISGSELAELYSVSRQVIVQDIALIRAAGYDIISTNRGYVLHSPQGVTRVFRVSHTDEQIADELCSIVDLGGKVLDVRVDHTLYGCMQAQLNIASRRNVQEFLADMESGKSSPLKNITANEHYHTVEADSTQVLDMIEQELEQKGYLVKK